MNILIRGARQLLTLRGQAKARRGPELRELGIISDGAVLIEDGVIKEAGPSRRVENLHAARGAHEIDATGRVVMPGFVDSHTHLIFGPSWLDEYETHADRPDLQATFRGIRTSSATRLESRARRTVDGLARHGTTTLEVKTGFGADQTGEIKILRVLAKLNRHPLDIQATLLAAPCHEGDTHRYLEWWISQLLPRVSRRKLARFADIRFDWAHVTPAEARAALEAARRLGFQLKVHCGPRHTADQVRMAVEMGAVSAGHVEGAGDAADAMLAQSETIGTLLPGAAFHLGVPCRPARELIARGSAVALATDYDPHTSPTWNMQMILSLACVNLRMTPAEAIAAATINGAYAVGEGSRIGSIEPGKDADILVLNVSDYREIPFHFGCNQVQLTMKRGVIIYREGSVERHPAAAGPVPLQ